MKKVFIPIMIVATMLFISNTNIETDKYAEINTDFGVIKIKLYKETPLHTANFLKMIDNGNFNSGKITKIAAKYSVYFTGAKNSQLINNEFDKNILHKTGALAADISKSNTAKSKVDEFFIVTGRKYTTEGLQAISNRTGNTYTSKQKEVYKTIGGVPAMDGKSTVFGEIIEGFDVLENLRTQEVMQNKGYAPVNDISFSIKKTEK